MATPAVAQNTGQTGGGNRPIAVQRSLTQVVSKTNASITNTTGSVVTITLDPADEVLQIQAGETRAVSCNQKVWVGDTKDGTSGSTVKPIDLTCQARYQMRASGDAVEIVPATLP
jgi:hypothetical protein